MAKHKEVKLENIPQKSIKRFLEGEELRQSSDFQKLRSSRHLIDDSFHHHYREFSINAPLAQVWQTYLQIPPAETWDIGLLSYGFTYDSKEEEFSYPSDEYRGLREGQILFLNLRLLFGLVDITITHKVLEIDHERKSLLISYLEKNKSAGSQHISFSEENGQTLIRHKTRYKSDSPFRDKMVYPLFHGLIIRKFHRNIFDKIEQS